MRIKKKKPARETQTDIREKDAAASIITRDMRPFSTGRRINLQLLLQTESLPILILFVIFLHRRCLGRKTKFKEAAFEAAVREGWGRINRLGRSAVTHVHVPSFSVLAVSSIFTVIEAWVYRAIRPVTRSPAFVLIGSGWNTPMCASSLAASGSHRLGRPAQSHQNIPDRLFQ